MEYILASECERVKLYTYIYERVVVVQDRFGGKQKK